MSEEMRRLVARQGKITEIIERKKKRQADMSKLISDVDKDIAELEAEFTMNEQVIAVGRYEGDSEND